MPTRSAEPLVKYVDRFEDPSGDMYGPPKPERDALNTRELIDQVGLRVIRIEQVGNRAYGTLEGEIVPSDEKSVLCIRCTDEGVIHRFLNASDFRRNHAQFFIESTRLRRRRYVTSEALQWRSMTYEMFSKAVGKGMIPADKIPYWKEQGGIELARHLGVSLNAPFPTDIDEIVRRLNDL